MRLKKYTYLPLVFILGHSTVLGASKLRTAQLVVETLWCCLNEDLLEVIPILP